MSKHTNTTLSVRPSAAGWAWLEDEAARRSRAAGVKVGPSTIVRQVLDYAAGSAEGADLWTTIQAFRRDHLREGLTDEELAVPRTRRARRVR